MGGTSLDEGWGIAVDGSGNVHTTGNFQDTADFDPGPGTSNLTSNGSSDVFVSKLDSNGNFVWAKNMGGGADHGLGIEVDGSGNIHTTGIFNGTADFDPGPGSFNLTSNGGRDVFVSKLDSDGNFVWAKSIGGAFADQVSGIALDGSGNVHTTGFFGSTADLDPGLGTFNLTSNGSFDIFISKLGHLEPLQPGTIIINKITDPPGGRGFRFTENITNPVTGAAANGFSFRFTENITNPVTGAAANGFSLDDGQMNTFSNVVPDTSGSYMVTEDEPLGGARLTDLVCLDSDSDGIHSTTDIDAREVTINLDPDETVTCTFTNTLSSVGGTTTFLTGGGSSFSSIVPIAGGVAAVVVIAAASTWYTRKRRQGEEA